MSAPARVRLARLTALAALSVPVAAGVLLVTPARALADDSPSTITCATSGGSGTCGAYLDTIQVVITAHVGCTTFLGLPQCMGDPAFVVRSPTGATLSSQSLGTGKSGSMSYALAAGSPDGRYTASLSGGGAAASATVEIEAPPPPPPPTTAAPASTTTTAAPTSSPTTGSSTGAGGSTGPPSGGPTSGAPATGGGSTPPGSTTSAASSAGETAAQVAAAAAAQHKVAASFRSFAPPAGIAQLPPLPQFPTANTNGEPTDPGTYAPTLPYDGSVTVAEKVTKPTLLGHVTGTFDNRQVVESVAAACLVLLVAAHLRRLVRRPSGDADL